MCEISEAKRDCDYCGLCGKEDPYQLWEDEDW